MTPQRTNSAGDTIANPDTAEMTRAAVSEATGALTAALVQATERQASLQELTSLITESLSQAEGISYLLENACGQFSGTSAVVLNEETEAVFGETSELAWLKDAARLRLQTGQPSILDNGAGLHAALVDVVPATSPPQVMAIARSNGERFTTGDRRMLGAFGATLTGVLEVADLHEQAIARAIEESDYNTATALAQAALPSWIPQVPGLATFARNDSARGAGGDFFTYQVSGDSLHFAVGDVSGKGLPAALVMTTVLSASNAAFQRFGDEGPKAMLQAINQDVYDYLSQAGLFVTMVAGTCHPSEGTLQVCNAGHSPILGGGPTQLFDVPASAPPIGVLPDLDLETETIAMEMDSMFVVASDGFTEQENPAGEMFGDARLQQALLDHKDVDTQDQGTALFALINEWPPPPPRTTIAHS